MDSRVVAKTKTPEKLRPKAKTYDSRKSEDPKTKTRKLRNYFMVPAKNILLQAQPFEF